MEDKSYNSFIKKADDFGLFNFSVKATMISGSLIIFLIEMILYFVITNSIVFVSISLVLFVLFGWSLGKFIYELLIWEDNVLLDSQKDKNARSIIVGKNELTSVLHNFNLLLDQKSKVEDHLKFMMSKVNNTVENLTFQLNENAEVSAAQSSSVAQTTATIKELATSAERIVQETSTVVSLAEETQHSAQKGADAIIVMLEKMSEIQAENQRRIQEIVVLGKKAQEIEKVMDIINDIASNTKIIAFNAGIEAASAGESGKRFGTVAAEIRKLANTVSNSTNEIRDKIKEIQKTTNELVIVSEEETKKIQGGVDTAQTMVKELTDILEKADKTLGWVKQISIATQQQLTASDQVAVVLHDISEGVRRFAQAASQTKETSAELRGLSDQLSNMAN